VRLEGNGSLFVSVRVLGAFVLMTTLATGAARASSFVVMGEAAPASTPSIISLGQPAPVKMAEIKADWQRYSPARSERSVKVETPSIIALGEPMPEITYEKVAAIPKKSNRGPNFSPQVIRGGVVGEAFAPASRAEPSAVATNTQKTAPQASASGDNSPSAPQPPPGPTAPPPAVVPKGMPQR